MLSRLIYASAATAPVDPKVISSILGSARAFNLEHGITGLLCEGNGKYLQYIEGTPESVDELYASINKDSRHTGIVTLVQDTITARAYDDWSMGFVSTRNSDVQKIVIKVTDTVIFDPATLTPEQALKLIEAFKMQLYPQVTMIPDAY